MESLDYLLQIVDSMIRNQSVKNVGEQMERLEYRYLSYQLEAAGKKIFSRGNEFAVANTKTLAAEVLNGSLRHFNDYWNEGGNIEHMRLAIEDVGTLILASAFEKRSGERVRVRSIQKDGSMLNHDMMKDKLAQGSLEASHV